MKRIYGFGRQPAKRNYTVADLKAIKGSGTKLSMSNPANSTELRACVDAGIDLLVASFLKFLTRQPKRPADQQSPNPPPRSAGLRPS